MLKNKFNISLIFAFCLFVFTSSTGIAGSKNPFNSIKASIQNNRGDTAYNNKDFEQAFKEYQSAAECGDEYGQFMLAGMYISGMGVKRSPKKYVYWIQQSADQGYSPANYLLGRKYFSSNPSTAAKYFKIAAKKEHESSMYMLGLMYAAGNGVSQNNSEALAWFRRAKAQGFPVDDELLSKSSIQSYLKQKKQNNKKHRKEKLAQQKLVRDIQQALTQLGFNPGTIDGLYGSKTRSAIQAFQRKYGMEPDGRVSTEILKKTKTFLK